MVSRVRSRATNAPEGKGTWKIGPWEIPLRLRQSLAIASCAVYFWKRGGDALSGQLGLKRGAGKSDKCAC
jgi:hypothetical protein